VHTALITLHDQQCGLWRRMPELGESMVKAIQVSEARKTRKL
jgi:hypothetical protein